MWQFLLPALGSLLSGAAGGSSRQRQQETDNALRAQQLAMQQARDTYGAGLSSAQFGREGQDRERKAAILMQLLNNTQDASITPGNPNIAAKMGTSYGGARPSNLTTNAEALRLLLQRPEIQAPAYTAPPPLNLQRAGRGESILGALGLGGSLLGLGSLFGGSQGPYGLHSGPSNYSSGSGGGY